MTILIDHYTGAWQAAIAPKTPVRPGMLIRMAQTPDDREADDFARHLRDEGLDRVWHAWMPRAKCDVFRIVRREE